MGHRALREAVGPPGADLPVVRPYTKGSTDWYIELLTTLDATDERDRASARVVLDDGGHYTLAGFRDCC